MRIDAYNQVSQIYQASQTAKTTKAGKVYGNDKVEISQFGKEFHIARQAVAEASDVRADKVASIKAKIDAGEYNVSAEDLAAKLAEKYNTNIF